MLMGQITYWFRATDDHRESGIEWLRQTGCAIAAAAHDRNIALRG